MELRQCNICGIIKELSKDNFQNFFNKKNSKIYFKNKCRECERKICKEYHEENRDQILARKIVYDQNNAKDRIKYRKEYNQKPEVKRKNATRALKRYYLNKHNPLFILRR